MHNDLSEMNTYIKRYINDMYQRKWDLQDSAYRIIQRNISRSNPNRKHEVIITRLLIGKGNLNKALNEQRRHPTGLCSSCNVPENVPHFMAMHICISS